MVTRAEAGTVLIRHKEPLATAATPVTRAGEAGTPGAVVADGHQARIIYMQFVSDLTDGRKVGRAVLECQPQQQAAPVV